MIKCKKCNKDLGHFNEIGHRVRDVDCKQVGLFCEEHSKVAESELKERRFVETYKNNQIYCKDGMYFPYWECTYSYANVEGARSRIDNSNIAVVDMNAFKFINNTLNNN